MNDNSRQASLHGYEVAMRVCTAKHWMVRFDGNVVGPVSLHLLERGLVAGKIPVGSQMAFMGGGPWRPVAEVFSEGRLPAAQPQAALPPTPAFIPPVPAVIPPPPPSVRYPEPPVSIPTLGVMAALFS